MLVILEDYWGLVGVGWGGSEYFVIGGYGYKVIWGKSGMGDFLEGSRIRWFLNIYSILRRCDFIRIIVGCV